MKRILAALLAVLLLLTLSACGQSKNNTSYIPEGENHYRAVHSIPRNNIGITTAEASDGAFFYITNEMVFWGKKTGRAKPICFASIDSESGEVLRYQALYNILTEYAKPQNAECNRLIAANADSSGNYSMVVEFAPTNARYLTQSLLSMDADFHVSWELPLDDITTFIDIRNIIRDDAGYTYLLTDMDALLVVDAQGNMVFEEKGSCHHMTRLLDGRIVLFQQSMAGDVWTVLQPDLEAGKMQTLCTLPCLQEGDPRNGGFYTGNSEYDLFCATDLSLYGIKLGTEDKVGTATQILSWINCNVDGTSILAFTAIGEQNFSVLTYSEDMGADLAFLEWQEDDIGTEKTLITIACRQLPETLSRAIQKFNLQHTDCQVIIRDYTTVSTDGIDRLTTDLNAGNMPDLFCMEGVNEQTLVNKGYLEDLWPYIDKDEQLGRDALVTPLFDAMSIDNKLYTLTKSFTLKTTLGLKALAGETSGWSFAEFARLVNNTPDLECLGNVYYDRDYALEDFLQLYLDDYIHWDTGKASFDSPEFIEAMEYLALYPAEIDRNWSGNPGLWVTEGQELFTCYELESVNDYDLAMIDRVSRKENAVWKGYPGLSGNGAAFQPRLQLAMASTSKNKEAAWEFLRTMLLPENQDFDRPGDVATVKSMPTNKAVFDEMVQAYVDLWSNPDYTKGVVNRYYENVTIDPWTQEDIDAFYALIEGATVVVRPQETIAAILRDEITRFFAGQ